MGLLSAPSSSVDLEKSIKILKKLTSQMSAKINFFSNFFAVEMHFHENYLTNPPEICVGVAPEHILVATKIWW